MTPENRIVSFDDEPLILVDERDDVLGYETKARCHAGEGVLHRAFSVFLFDEQGQTLMQQRSSGKLLWPLYWSNTCCSHPRRGESTEQAARRRLEEELGLKSDLEFLFKFRYQASFGDRGAEFEMCSVFAGRLHGRPRPNDNEIAAMRLMDAAELDTELVRNSDAYTPWFKTEWQRLRVDFRKWLKAP